VKVARGAALLLVDDLSLIALHDQHALVAFGADRIRERLPEVGDLPVAQLELVDPKDGQGHGHKRELRCLLACFPNAHNNTSPIKSTII
jgi:hypothetical protein